MKNLKPDDQAFLNELQRSAQSRPHKLSADKRAALHRALQTGSCRPRAPLRWALLASTLCVALMLWLAGPDRPSALQHPTASLRSAADASVPMRNLQWDMPAPLSTRLSRAPAKRSQRWQCWQPKSIQFESRTLQLKSKLQKLRKELT